MKQVSATRNELLARRARIELATQGRDLLKERRSALVREFHRLGASALESIDVLDRDAADASRQLGLAVAAAGPEPVASAAFAAQGEIELSVGTRSVAGVAIVEIEKSAIARARTARGYSLAATSARIDAVAERFETVARQAAGRCRAGALDPATRRRDRPDDAANERARARGAPSARDRAGAHRARLGGARDGRPGPPAAGALHEVGRRRAGMSAPSEASIVSLLARVQ